MTQQPEPSTRIKTKRNNLLMTSLGMIIVGVFLVIFNLFYFRSGGSVGTGKGFVIVLGVLGYLLTILGPILTIVRYKWLASVARSNPISSETKTLSIVSFVIGNLGGILLIPVAVREVRSGGLMYLIPAVALIIYAQVIRYASGCLRETCEPRRSGWRGDPRTNPSGANH